MGTFVSLCPKLSLAHPSCLRWWETAITPFSTVVFNHKSNKEMKNRYIKFRCSQSEKERIKGMAKRSGTSVSEYCRQQAIYGRILATPRLSSDEILYFRTLKEHNNALARLSNIIRSRDPSLCLAIAEYLERSRRLYSRFF